MTLVPTSVMSQQQDQRKLKVSFLFHFNQHHVPMGPVAELSVYRGLLRTLRSHPDIPFQIQISGTLLNDITWFGGETIQLIKEGVEDGQFEILGSTYAQNVMFASGNEWLNGQQIETHRNLLKQIFDVEPVGFWNPERVYTQSFVPLLANRGYKYTMVESHILDNSNLKSPLHLVRKTKLGESELNIIHDDTEFKKLFDREAIETGGVDSLLIYLRRLYEEERSEDYLVCYFQDAEASGLWQYERGEDPKEAWKNVDSALTRLKEENWIEITTGSKFFETTKITEEHSPIADGQADWMIEFAQNSGFVDWYHYLETDPIQNYFRSVMDPVRDSIHSVRILVEQENTPTGAKKLFHRAVRTFLAHEYEYGASWYWFKECADFGLSTEALVSLRAAQHALDPMVRTYREDINKDGVSEIVLVNEVDMVVLSPQGGRLLYWFDLIKGESLIGSENFTYYAEKYVDGNRYIPTLRGTKEVFPAKRNNAVFPEIFDMKFQIRRRALNDWIYVRGVLEDSLVFRDYIVKIENNAVLFSYLSENIELTKSIDISGSEGLKVKYSILNIKEEALPVTFSIENGFSPSYVKIMDYGPNSLKYYPGKTETFNPSSTYGIINELTGSGIYLEFASDPFYIESEAIVFGIEINPKYVFRLEEGSRKDIHFNLQKVH